MSLATVDTTLSREVTYTTAKPLNIFQELVLKTKLKPPSALKTSTVPASKPLVRPSEFHRIFSEVYIKKCDAKVSALQAKCSDLAEDAVALEIPGVGVFSTGTLKIMKRWHRAMKAVSAVDKTLEWLPKIDFTQSLPSHFTILPNNALSTTLKCISLSRESTHALDLAAKGCIGDDTMSTIMSKLFDLDQRVTIVDPSIVGIVLNGNLTVDTGVLMDLLSSRSTEYVLIPTNCNGNHWCSIMIRQTIDKISIRYYDPMNSNYTMHIRAVVHKIAGLMQAASNGVHVEILEYNTDVGAQLDNYNCGIYILLGFEHFVGAPAFGRLDKKALPYLRCRYLSMFYQ